MAELTLNDAERAFRRMQEAWRKGELTQEELLAEVRYRKLNEQFRGIYNDDSLHSEA